MEHLLAEMWANNEKVGGGGGGGKTMVLDPERTKPTERPPIVGEVFANFGG
jgi:hypothetical protein